MPDTSWNPPTGPPNEAFVRPADARYELESAIRAAQARDGELRDEVAQLATARVRAADRLDAARADLDEARSLAERALRRADETARKGERDESAKWTGAARVFAQRLHDARQRIAALEAELAALAGRAEQAEAAIRENARRLQAVAAARLPVLSGRRARRLQEDVDATLATVGASTDDIVARATTAAEVAAEAEAEEGDGVAPVTDDELEHELDLDGADEVLDELRTELGLRPESEPAAGEGDRPGGAGDTAGDAPARSGGGTKGRGTGKARKGKSAPQRSWPVPATRR